MLRIEFNLWHSQTVLSIQKTQILEAQFCDVLCERETAKKWTWQNHEHKNNKKEREREREHRRQNRKRLHEFDSPATSLTTFFGEEDCFSQNVFSPILLVNPFAMSITKVILDWPQERKRKGEKKMKRKKRKDFEWVSEIQSSFLALHTNANTSMVPKWKVRPTNRVTTSKRQKIH